MLASSDASEVLECASTDIFLDPPQLFQFNFSVPSLSGARCKRSMKGRHTEGDDNSQWDTCCASYCAMFHASVVCLKEHTNCTVVGNAFQHRCGVSKSSQQDFSTGLYFRHQPVSSSCVIVAIVTYFTVKCIPFFLRPLSMSITLVMKSVNFCHSEVTDASSDFKRHAERLHLKSQL